MPARRRKRNKKRTRGKKSFDWSKALIVFCVFIIIFLASLVFYIKTTSKAFVSNEKLRLAINANEYVIVSIFDPSGKEITNIYIPKNTQVESARSLGTLPLGNIWELGENENLAGKLLAETITRYMRFPVRSWADAGAVGFTKKEGSLLAASLFPYESNLGVGDKIRLGIYAFGVTGTKINNIYLADTSHLTEKKLEDASQGYVLSAHPKKEILSLFADPYISQKQARVVIKNKSDNGEIPKKMGEVLEVLGMKVANIKQEETQEIGCTIRTKDEKIAMSIADYFTCDQEIVEDMIFSAEIEIGEEFVSGY